MESFFSRYRNALVLIAVLLVQVIGLAVQVRRPGPLTAGAMPSTDKGGVRLIRSWSVDIVAPPERLLHTIGQGIRGVWSNYIDLIHIRQQNKDLQAQIDRLRLEQASLAEDARQGERLQSILGFQEKYIYKTVPAQVIGASGTEQSQVLLIDKGSRDGIAPDMPVITPDGVVGKTRDVFAHTSQVLEISDPTSGAGVILEKTRIRGVLRGNSWGQPEIVNLSPDERIQPGEAIVTSGGDAIYPRGLAVGQVQRVMPDPDGTLVNVLVKPAANLSRLEEVLVITSTGNVIPQQLQQDLSDAQQKASDILAERLPTRVDPNAPPDEQQQEQPLSEDSEGRPMRPPQAIHADGYSPAGTPPAASLVPGQRRPKTPAAEGGGAETTAPVKAPVTHAPSEEPGSNAEPGTATVPPARKKIPPAHPATGDANATAEPATQPSPHPVRKTTPPPSATPENQPAPAAPPQGRD